MSYARNQRLACAENMQQENISTLQAQASCCSARLMKLELSQTQGVEDNYHLGNATGCHNDETRHQQKTSSTPYKCQALNIFSHMQ